MGGDDEVVAGVVRRELLRPQLLPERHDGIHVAHRVAGVHHRREERHLGLIDLIFRFRAVTSVTVTSRSRSLEEGRAYVVGYSSGDGGVGRTCVSRYFAEGDGGGWFLGW